MAGKPYISIIIPCYNVGKYIDRCVESLVNQTIGLEALELIFINDASTDDTYEKLLDWEKRYQDSILVINNSTNMRQGGARNIGIRYASAEYVGFVDSDDWVDVTMYQKMYDVVERYHVDEVGVMYQREDMNGRVYHEDREYQGPKGTVFFKNNGEKRFSMPGGIWSKLYRKSVILDNDVFFPEHLVYEDNYWAVLLGYYVKSCYFIDEVLYHYFVNLESTIMSRDALHHMDRLEIEILKREELKRRGFYSREKERLDFQFLKTYYVNTLHIFFTKFQEVPYETIQMMQREVARQVPDFMENPYLQELNWIEMFFLKTAGMKLTKEDFEEIATGYRKDIAQYAKQGEQP